MAGFSENDTFKSNQIREGEISRKQALVLSENENRPRIKSLIWYLNTIEIDALKAILAVNQASKLY